MKRIVIVASICIFLELIFLLLLFRSFENTKLDLLEKSSHELEISYEKVKSMFAVTADLLFNEVINKKEILKLYSKASSVDKAKQNEIREKLYNHLIHSYNNFTRYNFRQLHFHLPDNTSFLRFHRPNKFGDNLSNIRSTVRFTNKNKVFSQGFEEGKIFNGFRNVFPLFYEQQHIGSVETSVSYIALLQQIEKNNNFFCDFIISKEVVNRKVFNSEKSNYKKCLINDNFLSEKEGYDFIKKKTINNSSLVKLKEDMRDDSEISDILDDFKTKSIYRNYNEHGSIIISFHSINNFENKPVAFIISYKEDEAIPKLITTYIIYFFLGTIILSLLVAFVLILYLSRRNELLKNEKINNQNIELLKLNATKDKFFSIIAHDLRNPFNAILGFSEILLHDYDNLDEEKKKEFISQISITTKNTFNLLENLLTWSRSQILKTSYNLVKVNISKMITEAVSLHKEMAIQKSIKIECGTEDYFVKADKNSIDTVLRNLISNAIKFTKKGGTVSIKCSKIGVYGQNDFVQVEVNDNGIGMTEETLSKLFNINENISMKGTNQEKGTGLGLIICKEFVESNGGKIYMESKIEEGSTFKFSLPYCDEKS